jgi:diguanylate cyclase (GGDEF)-like protein
MFAPPEPPDEAGRLCTLRSLNVLDTEPEERFDRVTRLARRLFGVPIALVSLVDSHRQWFKSRQGLDACETSRAISFCGHAILGQDLFVVPDAQRDERFADNPLVEGEPHIRFYAGYPLSAPNGMKLGTLCLIDREPRHLTEDDRELLRDLAAMVEQELAALAMATVDALTGLTNRLGFETIAPHALAAARRTQRPVTMLYLDLDRFKDINDTLGHAEGDRALVEMADLLLACFRDSDVVARLGGDEFCVLLTGASEADARRPLAVLDELVRKRNESGELDFALAYSVGCIAYDPGCHFSLAELLRGADGRMYAHKRERKTARRRG